MINHVTVKVKDFEKEEAALVTARELLGDSAADPANALPNISCTACRIRHFNDRYATYRVYASGKGDQRFGIHAGKRCGHSCNVNWKGPSAMEPMRMRAPNRPSRTGTLPERNASLKRIHIRFACSS